MKHILLILAFLSPFLVMGQVITPVDLTPPSDTPREGFQKLNTNDSNIKARLDSIVNAGLGGGSTTVPFDSITDLPTTLSGYGITDAWKTSGTNTLTGNFTITGNYGLSFTNSGGININTSGETVWQSLYNTITATGFNAPFTIQSGNAWLDLLGETGVRVVSNNGYVYIKGTTVKIDLGSDATGDFLQRNASGNISRLASVATGNVLISGGVGTVNSWGKVGLTTHVSGVLPVANGGTGSSSSIVEDNITDGATGTAPSENAVFDALALKATVTDLTTVSTRLDSLIQAIEIPPVLAPVIDGLPTISGTAVVGNTLTVTPSTVTGTGVTNTYQWRRNGGDIVGATATTYELVSDDYGVNITVIQIATNSSGFHTAQSEVLPIAPESVDPNIEDITVTYEHIQRTDETIDITTSTQSSVSTWSWSITKSSTGTEIATSTSANPSISAITTPGLYDLNLFASSATDVYPKRWRNALLVMPPKPDEGDCDIVVDYSASATASYFHDFADADNAGLIICIKGSHNESSSSSGGYFSVSGLRSSDPDNPVRIVKIGDTPTVIQNRAGSGSQHAIIMENCGENIVWDGYNTDGTRGGIKVKSNQAGTQLVMIRGPYDGFTFAGMVFDQNQDIEFTGSNVTFSPTYTSTNNATNHLAKNLWFYDNTILSASEEGIYVNFNNDGSINGFIPMKADTVVVAWNTITHTGRDGVQIGGSTGIMVHDNFITDWGWRHHTSHESAMSWNSGNAGEFFNNICIGGEMFLNIQSGNYPWNIFAGETTPRPSYFYSNVFDNGTYSPGSSTEPFNVFIQNQQNSGDPGPWAVHILQNTFINDKAWARAYGHINSFTYEVQNHNNIVVSPTVGMSTQGGGALPTITTNNLTRVPSLIDEVLFANWLSDDFTLSSFSSPAYSGSPTDLIELYPELSHSFVDVTGTPWLAPDEDFTFGAYSGLNGRVNDPTSEDAPTFSTALGASSIVANGFDVDADTDQRGWLYVVVTEGDESDPSDAQVLAGLNADSDAAVASFTMYDPVDDTMDSHSVTGLTSGTEYDIHAVFVSVFNVHTRATKVDDATTSSDASLPTLSNFRVSSLNRNRILFDASEPIQGTTSTGFTLADGKTITGVTIVEGEDHGYFTVNSAYVEGDGDDAITYTSGSNIQDINGNAVAGFGPSDVTNEWLTDWTEVEWVDGANVTITGNDIVSTSRPAYARSSQLIPSGSDGDVIFYQDDDATSISRDSGIGAACSLIDKDDDGNGLTDLLHYFVLQHNNLNVVVLQGSTTITTINSLQADGLWYRINIDRSTNKTRLYTASATYPSIPGDGAWTLRGTHSGTVTTDAVRASFQTWSNAVSQIGKGLIHVYIRCGDGLVVDTE